MISQNFLGLPVLPQFTMFCKILEENMQVLAIQFNEGWKTLIQDAYGKDLTISHRVTS